MSTESPQRQISAACEQDLIRYGDNFRGVGYTKSAGEAEERYAIMLDVIREQTDAVSVLDFGCGLGHLLDHINRHPKHKHVRYSGLDISTRYIEAARERHPEAEFLLIDVLESDDELSEYDYVILNGIFNFRGTISYERMLAYWRDLVSVAYGHCRRGIAFNAMSKFVDWERDDLFHLPFEAMSDFVASHLSRYFVIRHDYPAYEYTTYVYRTASTP